MGNSDQNNNQQGEQNKGDDPRTRLRLRPPMNSTAIATSHELDYDQRKCSNDDEQHRRTRTL